MNENNLIEAIIYCMENQNTQFYFNSKTCDISEEEKENYIPLPIWSSFDGFQTMENFTATLKNSNYKKQLIKTLENGKGVFRNFKDTLKKYPGLEEKYKSYKYNVLKKRVIAFLDSLSINKDLYLTNEENQYELTLEDFSIEFTFSNHLFSNLEINKDYKSKLEINDSEKNVLIKTLSEDVIGKVSYVLDNKNIVITSYFIEKDFRDLGLFTLAFNKIIEKEKDCTSLTIVDYNKEQILSNFLVNLNATKVYTEYKLDLKKWFNIIIIKTFI